MKSKISRLRDSVGRCLWRLVRRDRSIKPNGLPCGTFRVSIDDGFVEYSYDMKVGGSHSIASLQSRFAKSVGSGKSKAVMRTPAVLPNNFDQPTPVENQEPQ